MLNLSALDTLKPSTILITISPQFFNWQEKRRKIYSDRTHEMGFSNGILAVESSVSFAIVTQGCGYFFELSEIRAAIPEADFTAEKHDEGRERSGRLPPK